MPRVDGADAVERQVSGASFDELYQEVSAVHKPRDQTSGKRRRRGGFTERQHLLLTEFLSSVLQISNLVT